MAVADEFGGVETTIFGHDITTRLLTLILGSLWVGALVFGILLGMLLPVEAKDEKGEKISIFERVLGRTMGRFIADTLECLLPPCSYLYNLASDILFLVSVMQQFGGWEQWAKAMYHWAGMTIQGAKEQAEQQGNADLSSGRDAEDVEYVRQGLPEFLLIIFVTVFGSLFAMYAMAYYFPYPDKYWFRWFGPIYNLAGVSCMCMYSPTVVTIGYVATFLIFLAPFWCEILLCVNRILKFRDPRWQAAFTARENLEFWGQSLPVLGLSTTLFLDGYSDTYPYVMVMAGGIVDAFTTSLEKARLWKSGQKFFFIFPQDPLEATLTSVALQKKLEVMVFVNLLWCPYVVTGVVVFSFGNAVADKGMVIAGMTLIVSGVVCVVLLEIHAVTGIGNTIAAACCAVIHPIKTWEEHQQAKEEMELQRKESLQKVKSQRAAARRNSGLSSMPSTPRIGSRADVYKMGPESPRLIDGSRGGSMIAVGSVDMPSTRASTSFARIESSISKTMELMGKAREESQAALDAARAPEIQSMSSLGKRLSSTVYANGPSSALSTSRANGSIITMTTNALASAGPSIGAGMLSGGSVGQRGAAASSRLSTEGTERLSGAERMSGNDQHASGAEQAPRGALVGVPAEQALGQPGGGAPP